MSGTCVKERPILFSGPMVRALLDGRKTQTRRVVKPQPIVPTGERLHANLDNSTPPQWWLWAGFNDEADEPVVRLPDCPYGKPGDRLWVRESFYMAAKYSYGTYDSGEPIETPPPKDRLSHPVHYAADGAPANTPNKTYPNGLLNGALAAPDPYAIWLRHPSIHLPRAKSRITLEITDVRVQRLNDITFADCREEGCDASYSEQVTPCKVCDGNDPCDGRHVGEKWQFSRLWESINGPGSWEQNPWVWAITFKRVDEAGQ